MSSGLRAEFKCGQMDKIIFYAQIKREKIPGALQCRVFF